MRLTIYPLRGLLMAIVALQCPFAINSIFDLMDDLRHADRLYAVHERILSTDRGSEVRHIDLIIYYRNIVLLSSASTLVWCGVIYSVINGSNPENPQFLRSSRSGSDPPDVLRLSLSSDDFQIKSTSSVDVDLKRSSANASWSLMPRHSGQSRLTLTIQDMQHSPELATKAVSTTWINGRIVDSTDPPTIPIDIDVVTWLGLLAQLRLLAPVLSFVCALAACMLYKEPRADIA